MSRESAVTSNYDRPLSTFAMVKTATESDVTCLVRNNCVHCIEWYRTGKIQNVELSFQISGNPKRWSLRRGAVQRR